MPTIIHKELNKKTGKTVERRHYEPWFSFDPTAPEAVDRVETERLRYARAGDIKMQKAADIVKAYITGERSGKFDFMSPRTWPPDSGDALDLVLLNVMLGVPMTSDKPDGGEG